MTTENVSVRFPMVRTVVLIFCAGIIGGSGARFADWLIPAPPLTIEVKREPLVVEMKRECQ